MSFFLEIHYSLFLIYYSFETWLVCRCCFLPKLDMHHLDLCQKGSSTLFLEYQKGCLSLARMPFALFNFCFEVLMWSLKSKCSSNKTPRYLVQVFCIIFWPLKWKFIFLVICFLGNRKITIWTRFDRSRFIFLYMSLRELLVYNRFVSFENFYWSFMYMRNNKGPKMGPCGMPYLIFWISDIINDGCLLSSVTEIAFEPIKSYYSDAIMV